MRSAKRSTLLAAALSLPFAAVGQTFAPPIASYEISCRLDTEKKTVEGTELLTWTNRTSRPAATLQFHLYLNAFRNTLSTYWRESGGKDREGKPVRESFGAVEVSRMTFSDGTDLLPSLAYL